MPVSFMMLTRQEKELESEIINPTASREGSVSDMLRTDLIGLVKRSRVGRHHDDGRKMFVAL